ncbi:MAG: pseudouridine-5'-phosphate glycosidase [Clostridiaceae bacterium]
MNNLSAYLDVNDEVKKAIEDGKPVVALESTIIAHGMPYPKNVETALNVEKIIRDNGAVPATIAILKGRLKAGLTPDEIEYLGKSKNVLKASRRDIPFIVAKELDGATTVASTMIVAALAGIKIFATGGIGGVHRKAQETFDISADLDELANTNVAVICAGAKSILDLGLTLEYLETKGVPVVGFKTEELPAFYTRKSGFGVDYRVDSEIEAAKTLKAKWDLGLKGGMVIANPVPEEFQMNYDVINAAIDKALKEADEKGIKGKETTPFLLAKIKDITGGDSLETNIKLVYNNAEVAAKIACELSKL